MAGRVPAIFFGARTQTSTFARLDRAILFAADEKLPRSSRGKVKQ
jgi:hypothetical protein